MKAVFIDRFGGPEVVQIGEQPLPELRPDDLRVRVKAASVNPIDFKTRAGEMKILLRYRFPLLLGSDLSGVVTEVGSAVTRFRAGDEIFARVDKTRIGTFAEVAHVREGAAARKPQRIDHVQAASLPLVGLTTYQAFLEVAKLAAGQKVLVHAGSGGIGSFALQLAKHLGAHVATTASARNRDLCLRLGADEVIDYKTQRFDELLRDFDVVYDTLGGVERERSFAVLRRGGVMVSIAGLPDPASARAMGVGLVPSLALRFLARKTIRLARQHGVSFSQIFMRPDGDQLAAIAALVDAGKIEPLIDQVFSLDEARAALARSESGRAVGKVVIRMD